MMKKIEFTIEELEKNFLPQSRGRAICKKSIALIQPIMAESDPTEIYDAIENDLKVFDLDKHVDSIKSLSEKERRYITKKIDQAKPLVDAVEKPLSDIFLNEEKKEEIQNIKEDINLPNFDKKRIEELAEELPRKVFFSTVMLKLIMKIYSFERDLLEEKKPSPDLKMANIFLESSIEMLNTHYRSLLHLDSEEAIIKHKVGRINAGKAKNKPAKELHLQFFYYYETHQDKEWSKRECARRFYLSLDSEKQKTYQDEDHARRQFTDALRKHLSSK